MNIGKYFRRYSSLVQFLVAFKVSANLIQEILFKIKASDRKILRDCTSIAFHKSNCAP